MIHKDSLDAFSTAAGISGLDLSLFIRISILSSFLIWAAWCVLQVLKYYKSHPHVAIANLLGEYARIFFLVSLIVALVFVP